MVPGKHQQPDGSNNISNPQTRRSSSRSCLILLLGDQMANSPLLSIFFLVAIADCLAFIGLYIPYTYLPSAAQAAVPSASASFGASLISLMGVGRKTKNYHEIILTKRWRTHVEEF